MTPAAATPDTSHPRDEGHLPGRTAVLTRLFAWWVRGYLRKHFRAVRLTRGTRPDLPLGSPVVVVLNHPSWWDPLVGLVLAGLFPERTHYAPIDAAALARYGVFRRLGFYGVEPGTPRGAAAFLRTTGAILARPGTAVWVTAQGRFTDPRVRPPGLRPGIGHVARRLDRGVIVPLALEYPFWEERLPEALARFGEPIRVERGRDLGAAEWVDRVESHLAAAQDALAADARSRDPAAFDCLLTGRGTMHGVYGWWRRGRAWLHGEPFRPWHSPDGRPPWS